MNNQNPNTLKIGNKYCIIYCNSWYEAKLKGIGKLYEYDQFIFSTKLGDIYLHYSTRHSKWQWQNPLIYENRFEAILKLGLLLFQGKGIRRTPYTQEKHIDICLKHIPEKMV